MRKLLILVAFGILALSCEKEIHSKFSEEVLAQQFVGLDDQPHSFKEILGEHQGKQIVIDIWASWCRDCILEFPELKQLQEDHLEAVYLFLSADRSKGSWKRAIEKYQLQGEHFFLPEGTDGVLGDFLDIDWIPRYLIVDADGNIEVFEAIEAKGPLLRNALNKKL